MLLPSEEGSVPADALGEILSLFQAKAQNGVNFPCFFSLCVVTRRVLCEMAKSRERDVGTGCPQHHREESTLQSHQVTKWTL